MKKAIGIKVKKADGNYDLGSSKFFGTPTIPSAWASDFTEDEIFFCQIKLSDLSIHDKENILPHNGYLYIFLYTEQGEYALRADVRYYDGEPELALDDFNAVVEGYEQYTRAYIMEFFEADECEACTRLFGTPTDWNYDYDPPRLLMQFDPLDSDMGFLGSLDGYIYFFFNKNSSNYENIFLMEEYS